MKDKEAKIGTRVKSLRNFSGVPKGTEGIIDEDYGSGVMVAWDLKKRPLPAIWCDFRIDSNKCPRHLWPLRDGFAKKEELDMLELA